MNLNSLRASNTFLNWRYEQRGGAKKPTKVPYSPLDNYAVGTDEADRHRLTAYAAARNNLTVGKPVTKIDPARGYDGTGFVFTRFYDTLYICGIDIDHNAFDGEFTRGIMAMFPNAYIERSPSGEGVHIVLLVDVSRISSDYKARYYMKNPRNGVEAYIAGVTNRYFTHTGDTIQDGTDTDQTGEFLTFLDLYMQKDTGGASQTNAVSDNSNHSKGNQPPASILSDEEIIAKAKAAANGAKFIELFDRGGTDNYSNDHSGADMALLNLLAFWTRQDAAQMERLFDMSALGQRGKWRDRADYRQRSIDRAIRDAQNIYEPPQKSDPLTDFDAWGDIQPLDTITPPPFPLECYPETIGNYACAVAEYTQTDPAMSGVAQLGLLGALFQNKLDVVSVNGNHEQTSIDAVVILPPAERKSEVIRLTVRPVNQFETDYNREHRAELSKNKAEKTLRQKALDAAQRAKDCDIKTLCRAQQDFDDFQEMKPLTLVADDTTVEALISIMKDNGERMLIASDEGGIFAHMKGRYKLNGDDMEIYLKAHSGGRVSVHRKSREPEVLENPALSMIIAVQPYVVENCVLDEENNGRGLTARFIYACCEERAGTRQAVSVPLDTAIVAAYENAVKKCLERTITEPGVMDTDYRASVRHMTLSEQAREFAIQYFTVCESRILDGLERAKGWNGKCFGLAIRIAGLFHAFACMERGKEPEYIPIPLETMQNAATVAECLAIHAEKVFIGNDRKFGAARHLLKILGAFRGNSEINKQEVWQKVKRRYQTMEALDEALKTLEENNYIKQDTQQTKGRPKTVIFLNPQCHTF
jgi:hypothetical protein